MKAETLSCLLTASDGWWIVLNEWMNQSINQSRDEPMNKVQLVLTIADFEANFAFSPFSLHWNTAPSTRSPLSGDPLWNGNWVTRTEDRLVGRLTILSSIISVWPEPNDKKGESRVLTRARSCVLSNNESGKHWICSFLCGGCLEMSPPVRLLPEPTCWAAPWAHCRCPHWREQSGPELPTLISPRPWKALPKDTHLQRRGLDWKVLWLS